MARYVKLSFKITLPFYDRSGDFGWRLKSKKSNGRTERYLFI